jgi:uncharacterized protein
MSDLPNGLRLASGDTRARVDAIRAGDGEALIARSAPTPQQLTDAFWQACHGGQRRMAAYLLAVGAELDGTPSRGGSTPLDAAESLGTGRDALLTWLREQGAKHSAKASA